MAEPIDEHFTATISALSAGERASQDDALLGVFDAQLGSRHLDLAARALRAKASARMSS